MGSAVATLSGGLDSAIAAALYRADPANELARCLFFDYGQRASVPERKAATALAGRWGVPLRCLALPWLGELAVESGSALMPAGAAPPEGTEHVPGDERTARAVWVPARNAVFVAVAAAQAEACGADAIVTGFNREEAATFPDNSADFVTAANRFLGLGTMAGVRVVSPTLGMDKTEIVQAARDLGYVATDFWSCYQGGEQPCGRCESCLRSRWS